MSSMDKLLRGLQNIKSGNDDSSNSTENLFTLGEVAHNAGDFDKALNYYLKAADSGDSNAMFRLGIIYIKGFGYDKYNVPYNLDLGIEWMKKAGKANNIEAMEYLADVYAFGFRGIDSNFTEAVYWFKKAIEHGDEDALNKLMDYYWTESRDNEFFAKEALKFYQSLADEGNVNGIENLARCYAEGRGVLRNKYKAIELFKTAANFQSVYAMNWLGTIYTIGTEPNDRDIDLNEAIKWFEKAAALGSSNAMQCLADIYSKKGDHSSAIKWHEKDANLGNKDAMIRLADFYSDKGDYSNAVKWYEKFGKSKLSHSQYGRYYFALAGTYRYGQGVDKDLKKAILRYSTAEEYGHNEALRELQSIYSELTRTQKREMLNWAEAVLSSGGGVSSNFIDMLKEKNKPNNSSSGCFITTAVCRNFGKSDDCYELMTFRKFRDTWLSAQPDGKSLIDEYYSIAPAIVNKINHLTESNQVYEYLWHKYLSPCLNLIKQGENMACKQLYFEMIKALKKKFLNKEP